MKRFLISSFILGCLAVAPTVTLSAQDHKAYYDKVHKENHEWNDAEAAAWARYRTDHHIKKAEFDRASKRDQQAYWNWRHDHPDAH